MNNSHIVTVKNKKKVLILPAIIPPSFDNVALVRFEYPATLFKIKLLEISLLKEKNNKNHLFNKPFL
jgi:hypothetical protein